MNQTARFLKALSVSFVVIFAFSACQGREQAKEAQTPANPAVADASLKGTVTFLCGAATMTVGGTSAPLDIGAAVPVDATVATDKDGVCEIQFADFGSIHIAEGSTLVVKKFVADSTHTESEMQLTAGKVVCKVKKLSGNDSFQIRTPEMVCGVRGTVFQVSREENKPVKIAVSEGSVAVYPPSLETTDKLAAPIAEELHECAPVVAAGQEAAVTAETMKALDQSLTTLVAASESDSDKSATENVTAYKKIAASVLTEVAPVSAEAKVVFTEASNLVLGTTPAWQGESAAPDQSPAQDAAQGASQDASQAVPVAAHVPAKVRVIVTVDPADAKTTINGTAAFTGSFSGLYEVGTNLDLKVESEGFGTVEESFSVSGTAEIQKAIHLVKKAEAKPEAKAEPQKPQAPTYISVAPQKLVGVAVAPGGMYFASDSKSVVYALSSDGKVLWTAKTANGTNSINPPVAGSSCVAFMGDKVLSVFDGASGKALWSLNLDKTNTGLYGRHAAIAKDKLYLTGDSGISVYDLKTGSSVGAAPFDDGSDMSPAFSGGKLHVVSKTGVWHSINSDTFALENSLETGAVQPVASAPVVRAGTLVFADRKGTVTAVDISKSSILWQTKLDESRSVDVFIDPVVTANAAYVFAKGKLYALSLASGKPLFPAVDAAAQGCIAGGNLWVGGASSLSAISPVSGASVKKIAVPSAVSGTPAVAGSNLLVPLANGQIMVMRIE